MSNGIPPHDEASIGSKTALVGLLVLNAGNYLLSAAFLAGMHLSNAQRATALFAGIALGYASSGRVLGTALRGFTAWRQDTCILVGSFLAHLLGAFFAVGLGRLLVA